MNRYLIKIAEQKKDKRHKDVSYFVTTYKKPVFKKLHRGIDMYLVKERE